MENFNEDVKALNISIHLEDDFTFFTKS